jgi:CheY-like chemotaxis protein
VEYFTKTDTTATLVTDGSGLGLSIARGLVKLLGGDITVESTLHKGTTFRFTLPAVTVVPTVVEEETKKKQLRVTKNPVILVAEDDDYNYKFIETVLNRADFKVVRAENGLEAVNICHENPNVNLVLMDLKMPVMGGIEATRQIKSFLPALPVIALTAYVTSENENEAFLSGCKEFISKPVDRAHLLTTVGNSLGN